MTSPNGFQRFNKFTPRIMLFSGVIVAVILFATIGVFQYVSQKQIETLISKTVQQRAQDANSVLAQQISQAEQMRSQNVTTPAQIGEIVDAGLAQFEGDVVGAVVIGQDRQFVFETAHGTFAQEAGLELAEGVFENGETASDSTGWVRAVPIMVAPVAGDAADTAVDASGGLVTYVLVTKWSPASQLAQVSSSSGVLALILVGAVLSMIAFLSVYLFAPVARLNAAMLKVSDGHFGDDISGLNRADEVGSLARNLTEIQSMLKARDEIARSDATCVEGFHASVAPTMLTDGAHTITQMNRSCVALLKKLSRASQSEGENVDSQDLIGTPFSDLPEVGDVFKTLYIETAKFPILKHLKWADLDILLTIDRLNGDLEHSTGYVINWQDMTERNMDRAVLDALEVNQLRLDMNADWKILASNQTLIDGQGNSDMTSGQVFDFLVPALDEHSEADATIASFRDTLAAGKSVFGCFECVTQNDGEMLVDGGFVPIFGQNGAIERIIFFGHDSTQAHKNIEQVNNQQTLERAERTTMIETLAASLEKLSKGDLTANISGQFPEEYAHIKENFNQATQLIHDEMQSIVESADRIRVETEEITGAADNLAVRTEKQAATLEETAAALEQLTSSVVSATDSADKVSEMAIDAKENAEMGGEVSRQANEAMDEIRKSSMEISKITSVIDEIAFQTNLLALNAGVEAARAGDAGRGFAVVATEVRALAQRSSDAASEINSLISASGQQVKSGVALVNQTGTALGEIVSSVGAISTQVTDIAVSSREQAVALNEINTAVNDLDQVTQQNAAMFEQTTAASHSLTSDANAMVVSTERFGLKRRTKIHSSPSGAKTTNPPQSRASKNPTPMGRMRQERFAVNASPPADQGIPSNETSWEEF